MSASLALPMTLYRSCSHQVFFRIVSLNGFCRSFVRTSGLTRRFSGCKRLHISSSKTLFSKHLDRMAGSPRNEISSPATVISMTRLSPTVQGLTLKLHHPDAYFKSGQWVDFYIPELDTVGGYSMCSAPHTLRDEGTIDLAVKYSLYAPSKWFHDKCAVGSEVTVRVGGNFYYDPKLGDPSRDVLLIAGGVGINPLLSMSLHIADLRKQNTRGNHVYKPGNVLLLYSAVSQEELVFKNEIEKLHINGDITARMFVTKEKLQSLPNPSVVPVINSSLTCDILRENIKDKLNINDIDCYLCGPPPMIDAMEAYLLSFGITSNYIHFEKWW